MHSGLNSPMPRDCAGASMAAPVTHRCRAARRCDDDRRHSFGAIRCALRHRRDETRVVLAHVCRAIGTRTELETCHSGHPYRDHRASHAAADDLPRSVEVAAVAVEPRALLQRQTQRRQTASRVHARSSSAQRGRQQRAARRRQRAEVRRSKAARLPRHHCLTDVQVRPEQCRAPAPPPRPQLRCPCHGAS